MLKCIDEHLYYWNWIVAKAIQRYRNIESHDPYMSSWAAKYQESGLEVLHDQPRSGRPIEIAGDQLAKITAMACSEPPEGYARWSLRLLADKAVELAYCDHISHTEVNKIITPALAGGAREKMN